MRFCPLQLEKLVFGKVAINLTIAMFSGLRLTWMRSKVTPLGVKSSSDTVTSSAAVQLVIRQSSEFDIVDSGSVE